GRLLQDAEDPGERIRLTYSVVDRSSVKCSRRHDVGRGVRIQEWEQRIHADLPRLYQVGQAEQHLHTLVDIQPPGRLLVHREEVLDCCVVLCQAVLDQPTIQIPQKRIFVCPHFGRTRRLTRI